MKDFVDFLDLRGSHKSVPTPPIYIKKKVLAFEEFDFGSIVNWKKFIRALDLETDLHQAGN